MKNNKRGAVHGAPQSICCECGCICADAGSVECDECDGGVMEWASVDELLAAGFSEYEVTEVGDE